MAVDADLAAALKQARSKKMFFAFIPKGSSDGTLIVSKAKVPPKKIAEAKKEIGGGQPLTGKCFGDSKSMVFQVAKPGPATLGPALKKVMLRDAGLKLLPDVQVAGDADADEPDGSAANGAGRTAAAPTATAAARPASAAASPAANDPWDASPATAQGDHAPGAAPTGEGNPKEAVKKRLAALVGPYKQAMSLKGQNVAKMESLMADVRIHVTNGNFDQAGKKLDELEPLVQGALVLAAGKQLGEGAAAAAKNLAAGAAAAGARVSAAMDGPLKEAVKKRLAALAGPYKEAVAKNAPNAVYLKGLREALEKHLTKNEFVQAAQVLDVLEPAVAGPKTPNTKDAYGDTAPVAVGGAGGRPPQDPPPPGGKGGGAGAGGGAGDGGSGGKGGTGGGKGPGSGDPPPQGGGRGGDTVASNAGSVAPRDPNERVPGDTRRVVAQPPPPDNAIVTVRTAKGPEKMTAQEYRARVRKAEGWVYEQRMAYQGQPGAIKGRSPPGLYEQAADQFGLDRGWQNPLNPIRYGRDVIVDGPKSPGSPPQDPSKGGGSGGGGQEGGQGGGNEQGQGKTPAEEGTGSNPAVQKAIKNIDDYVTNKEKFQQEQADFDRRQDALDARLQSQKDGQGNSADEAKALSKARASQRQGAEALVNDGEALAKRIYDAAPQELEAAFGVKGPDAVLKAARNAPPGEGRAAKAVGKLAGALFWAQSIYNVLKADDKLEALARIPVDYAGGALEAGIIGLFSRSTPLTVALTFVAGSCGFDGGAACEEEKEKQAAAQHEAEVHAMNLAIGAYLEKNFPGSVEWVEDDYKIIDKQLWNQTVKKLEELRKLKELEKQRQQQREMGKVHQKTPEEMVPKSQNPSPHMDPA